jgi:aldose 1-epimerase
MGRVLSRQISRKVWQSIRSGWTIMAEVFGHLPNGQTVHRLRLHGGGMVAHVLTLGAIVQDLRLEGVGHPLVLGADTLAPYLGPMQYFGAMVGRYANRIAQGQFSLGGRRFQLAQNAAGGHCLHGGPQGSAQAIWDIRAQSAHSVTLALHMPDGDMGFPGALDVAVTLALSGGALSITTIAQTTQATPCSFAHHGYFALDDSGTLARHSLRLAARQYLPTDEHALPTGQIAPVAGTEFDYLAGKTLQGANLDHNFCLSDRPHSACRPVAWLHSDHLRLEVATTQPGLQVYTANHLPQAEGPQGLGGRRYARHCAIALETQAWPDAPNQPNFPAAMLHPGQSYQHCTRYTFSRTEPAP